MKNKKEIKINLKIVVTALVVFIAIFAVIIYYMLNKGNNKNTNQITNNQNIAQNEVQNTIQSTEAKEIVNKKELDLQEQQLKYFLSNVAYLNSRKDIKEEVSFDGLKLTLTVNILTFLTDNNYMTEKGMVYYKEGDVNKVYKELFGEELGNITESGVMGLHYDKAVDGYTYQEAGDANSSTYVAKIENQTYEKGIYTITYLYCYPNEEDWIEGDNEKVGDYDCFRTKVNIKINDNYTYTKYQIVNCEKITSEKIGKIKEFV